jgi:hypothetical protein
MLTVSACPKREAALNTSNKSKHLEIKTIQILVKKDWNFNLVEAKDTYKTLFYISIALKNKN